MSKYFLFIAIVLQSIFTFSQQYNLVSDYRIYMVKYLPIKYKPEMNVKQIDFTSTTKKGKIYKYQKTYNENGDLLVYSKHSKKYGLKPYLKFEYEQGTDLIKKVELFNRNGDLKRYVVTERNRDDKPLADISYNNNDEIESKNTWSYDTAGHMISAGRYIHGEKLKQEWQYLYDEGKKVRTILKNGKGKVRYQWSFDCHEEGVKLEKVKDQTQVCQWTNENDSLLINVYQTFNEKGKIRKYVSKYSIKDTLIVERLSYNNDDELVHKMTYANAYEKPISSISYRHGREKFKFLYQYEGDLLIKEEKYKKGELYFQRENTYSDQNLLEESKSYGKKGELKRTIKLEYIM